MAQYAYDDDIKAALNDVDFPAGKDDIVRHAEQAGATQEVLASLRTLPLADYRSLDEVLRSTPDR
ncbi:DUF2795 domain-containing protein [Motilibacter aurantiacus]|uniref:DUF2795 domain-containing protein n=1 Tax=Motilibacter aurantiacus TaxID=2714955 RepID=UPI00140E2066|nr:DUF2795 domain-containing protein [Motilibacter aurantiacus]